MKYSTGAPKLAAVEFLKGFKSTPLLGDQWRQSASGAADMCSAAIGGLEQALSEDANTDNDMFFLEFATSACFISYFIPVDDEWLNVQKALLAVQKVVDQNEEYKVDLPVELRWIRGSDKAWMSPIFTDKPWDCNATEGNTYEDQPLWLGINVATVVGTALDSSLKKTPQTSFNKSFAKCWAQMEQEWISVGGKAHYGKYYGLVAKPPQEGEDGEHWVCFDPSISKDILPEANKQKMREKLAEVDPDKVFDRRFMQELLAPE